PVWRERCCNKAGRTSGPSAAGSTRGEKRDIPQKRNQRGRRPYLRSRRTFISLKERSTDVKALVLNPPTFGFIVATRAALAAGVGLLLAGNFSAGRRRTIGSALVAIGAATTIPAV